MWKKQLIKFLTDYYITLAKFLVNFYLKIIPGLFVGSIRDSRDMEQIKNNNISHILTIYDDPRQGNIEVKTNKNNL